MDESGPTTTPGAPEVAHLIEVGRDLLHKGRPESARVLFSQALTHDPKNVDAREGVAAAAVAMGHRCLDRGAPDEAISHFQMALEMVPFHPAADAGLRRAARAARAGRPSDDPFIAAIEGLAPVRALREAQAAERAIAKITGTPRPSQFLAERLDERRAQMERAGAPPREHRVALERAKAWERRWIFRALPGVAIAAAVAMWVVTGAAGVLMWGILLALFAGLWAILFVERRQGPGHGGST